jgi:hypothetical protein
MQLEKAAFYVHGHLVITDFCFFFKNEKIAKNRRKVKAILLTFLPFFATFKNEINGMRNMHGRKVKSI